MEVKKEWVKLKLYNQICKMKMFDKIKILKKSQMNILIQIIIPLTLKMNLMGNKTLIFNKIIISFIIILTWIKI